MNIIIKNFVKVSMIWGLMILSLLLINSNAYSFPYKGLDIKAYGAISGMYDDNINFAKTNKKDDFITTLGLGMDLAYEGKRRSITFGGNINFSNHLKFKDIKDSSESLKLNFINEFSDYDRISFGYNYSHSNTPGSFEEEFGRVSARQELFNNNFNLNYTREIYFSKNFVLSTKYNYSLNRITGETTNESSQNTLGIDMNYLYSIYTTFLFSYSYYYSQSSSDVSINTATLGLKQNITERLIFNGSAGVNIVSSNNNKDSTQNINISLTDEIDENTSAKLSFVKTDETISYTADVFSNWQINANFERQFLQSLKGSFSGFYGQGTLVSANITNTFLGANLAFTYEFWENLNGTFTYTYSNFNTTNEMGGYIRNTISLGITKAF